MPRGGWTKPESDRRLSDLVSVGVLTRVFPPDLVDEVITECDRVQKRSRSLPARVVAYFAIGMALHSEGSYDDVFAHLTDGLSWTSGWQETYQAPSRSAIFQARQRLGPEPLEALFNRVSVPLADEHTPGAFLAGRRMVAIDGTCLDVADTEANTDHFTRPGHSKGEAAAFPQARVVAMAECATHAILAASVGPCSDSEATLTQQLIARMTPGMLVLADRGFFSYRLWRETTATGADMLWRARTDRMAPKARRVEDLPDGSWLADLQQTHSAAARRAAPLRVRIVEYQIDDARPNPETYRLFTTLLDPVEAPAEELALAYARRWEIETAFDELKTHQRGPRTVLRSKSPDLVYQEIWGHLCCHYAIRSLMGAAAAQEGHPPDRVSFTAALRMTRSSLARSEDFSPSPT